MPPGTKLGPYVVQSLIGAGGMGEVYRARDASLKRDVAIKVLPASLSRDPDRLRRFQLEAEAAAALNHPNILSIHAIGQQDGSPYIVTELLEGETLRERLRHGALRLRDAIDIAIQVAKGLAAAHEKGIAHRDLKPENLFLAKDGRVKILDFGLAKLMQGPQAPTDLPYRCKDQTDAGRVLGPSAICRPEQVRGQPADARSDIFALGCVLYEMLTGKRAFRKPTAAETMNAILNEDPPAASEITRTIPPALQRVVHRCLEKAPERRFQSASDLAFALDALSQSGSGQTIPVGRTPSHRSVIWAAGVLLLTALAIGFYLRRSALATRPNASQASMEVRVLTESGKAYRAAATPDGRYVAYVKREAGKYELRLLQVAAERDVQLLPGSPQQIWSLHFSPDGNYLYFLRVLDPAKDPEASGVFRIAILGGRLLPLATDALPNSVTVSPDGKQVCYIARTPSESLLVAIDSDGGNRHVLAKRPATFGFNFVEWSPSRNTLAAVAIGKEDNGLVKVDLPAGSITDLSVSGWGAIGQPAWSPDGVTIFAPAIPSVSSIVQIWAFDARTGAHRPLTSSSTWYLLQSLSATMNGDLIANTSTQASTIWTVDRLQPPHSIQALRGEASDSVIWVGNQIVTSNIIQMMVHDPDGGNPTKLQSGSTIYRHLGRCGSRQVVYWANNTSQASHIARTDISTGLTIALTDGPNEDEPTCNTDGSLLVFRRCTEQGPRCSLVRKSLDSGQSSMVYEFDPLHESSSAPSLSPDGRNVLFFRHIDGGDPYEWAAIIPISGGNLKTRRMPVRAGEVVAFKWAADGKSILYARNENGVGNMWSAPLDGKAARKLTNFDADRIFAFDVSPGGRLVASRGEWVSDVVLIKDVR